MGLRQMPIASPGLMSQMTLPAPGRPVPGAPQQSLVLPLGLRGALLRLRHGPPQQALPLVQAPLSWVHATAQWPATQLNEQQSVLAAQLPPAATQLPPPTVGTQACVAGSHSCEQQSL